MRYAIITDYRCFDRKFAVVDTRRNRVLLQTNDSARAHEFAQQCVEDDAWHAQHQGEI